MLMMGMLSVSKIMRVRTTGDNNEYSDDADSPTHDRNASRNGFVKVASSEEL